MDTSRDFALGIAESVAGEIWDTPTLAAHDAMLEQLESHLAAQARATGNAHSVAHTIEGIRNNG